MTHRPPRASVLLVALALPVAAGCPANPSTSGTTESTSDDPSTGTATTDPPGTSSTSATTSDVEPTTTSQLPPDMGGSSGGQCNLFLQDCKAGEKCTAWNMDGGVFPNGTKCVPATGEKEAGEGCTVDGMFGEGIDDCAKGSICLDLDNNGTATCVAYCAGSMEAPSCPEATDECAFLFEPTVPLCFPACDPLAQDCNDGDACVPNVAVLGAEYFVCMPMVGTGGTYKDTCALISGCDEGFQCIPADNVPGCNPSAFYCCSVWCDLETPETCLDYDQTIACVPWYEEGKATPGYENVGICGVLN